MPVFHILLSNKIHHARLTWLEIHAKLEIHYLYINIRVDNWIYIGQQICYNEDTYFTFILSFFNVNDKIIFHSTYTGSAKAVKNVYNQF